jgi:WD40 repeat protein
MKLNTQIGQTNALDFSFDGLYMLLCGYNQNIEIWDINSWTLIKTINTGIIGAALPFFGCKYAPDGKFVAMSFGSTLAYNQTYVLKKNYTDGGFRLAINPNSKTFLVASYFKN